MHALPQYWNVPGKGIKGDGQVSVFKGHIIFFLKLSAKKLSDIWLLSYAEYRPSHSFNPVRVPRSFRHQFPPCRTVPTPGH